LIAKIFPKILSAILTLLIGTVIIFAQERYNHPELDWLSFETPHFKIHYHEGAEWTAKETALIGEAVYGPITSFYNFEPDSKTHLYVKDYDDYSNGATYYYDNKIELWATPLDFLLRGNHQWLRDVIAHEFAHIVSLQKAMKLPRSIPAAYLQVIDYEDEKRDDVVYGYPRVIASYPLPGLVMPMWLAEGVAQFQYPGSTNDLWDTHRDMLLRDRVLNHHLLSLDQMGSFGKRGIGNESVYNQGYAFVRYLTGRFGSEICPRMMDLLSAPLQFSVTSALKKATGVSADEIYRDWKNTLEKDYAAKTERIRQHAVSGEIILGDGTTQIYPEWGADTLIYYLSNKGRDYYGQTSLYVHNAVTNEDRLLKAEVHSRISLSPDNKYLYYSKKSKPNKHGSVYFDIYHYDLHTKKEKQITKFRRAYLPALSPDGKKIVFITGEDGTSNLVLLDLESREEKQLTHFDDGIELFSVHWAPDGKRIAFDYTLNHGRDISVYHLESDSMTIFDGHDWDTRNPYYSPDGRWLYYASDQTGIFNIYRRLLATGETELLTNVVGGAMMPAVNRQGQLVFALFDNSAFKVARLDTVAVLAAQEAVYFPEPMQEPAMMAVVQQDFPEPQKYRDQFAKIFILPKLMIDYGTVKPGFYFYSSEILERFSIFGTASLNRIGDRDLFVTLEYHQWEPTFFLEFYNISRNILNQKLTWKGYPINTDYTFYLTEAIFGVSRPIDGFNHLRLDAGLARYRTSTDERIESQGIYSSGFTYDYYRGSYLKLSWNKRKILPNVNSETNPDNGFEMTTNISRNFDNFMQEFGIYEDFGTLREIFRKNYYWKIDHEGNVYHKYPVLKKMVGNFKWRLGWISMPDVDSFFHFFAGGLPGLRGYPFYSIEGRNLLTFHYTLRHPLFVEKDLKMGIFNLQNAFVGAYVETGNAWNQVKDYPRLGWKKFANSPADVIQQVTADFKTDVGMQLRFSGFSFYAYPTAISLDFVYGLDKFELIDRRDEAHIYGGEWRTYITILFGL